MLKHTCISTCAWACTVTSNSTTEQKQRAVIIQLCFGVTFAEGQCVYLQLVEGCTPNPVDCCGHPPTPTPTPTTATAPGASLSTPPTSLPSSKEVSAVCRSQTVAARTKHWCFRYKLFIFIHNEPVWPSDKQVLG